MSGMERAEIKLNAQVAVATMARLVINIGHRIAYPFLPAIARGLDVPIQSAGILITLLLATGLLSPLFGPLSDRFGRRRLVTAGMVIVAGGAGLIATARAGALPVAAAGFVLLGLGKVAFDPSWRAYLGDRIPYRQRGRTLAITELSWAGGLLIGAPAAGWLIAGAGWRAPFAAVAGLALVGALALWRVLPGRRSDEQGGRGEKAMTMGRAVRIVLDRPAAVAALAVTALIMMAHELLFVVYGTWMESSFGLSLGGLGLATAAVGAGELLGELGAGGLVDRLGKRRAIALGLALTTLCYLVWPLTAQSLVPALISLFFLLLFFEFTFVATLPLITELVPQARATMVSLNGTVDHLGRSLGALLALPLWAAAGLWGNGLVAGAATLGAMALLLAFVRPED
jgi:predicted MFS family arabinose efflux permease